LGSASTKDSFSNIKFMPRFEERFDYINDSHFDMAEETEKFIIEKLEQEITTQQKTSSLKYNFSC
jgi:hypothetical protein